MFRSPKEQIVLMPELQWGPGSREEAEYRISAERAGSEWTAAFTSTSEQWKRTPRKPFR